MSTAGRFNTSAIREIQQWQDYRTASPYEVARSLYNGNNGIGGRGSYLVPNASELYYQTRKALTPYTPWYRLYIDAQIEPLYQIEPPRYEVSANMEGFIDNCNRAGVSVDDFKMDVTTYAIMDGVVFLASGYDGDTEKYPYLHYFTAQQYNKALSVSDKFGAVVRYVFTISKNDDEYEHNVYEGEVYRQYKASAYDELGEPTTEETRTHPIKAVYSQRREQGVVLPIPKNNQVAGLCVAVYNSESDQRWVLRVQGHSIFVISSDVVPDGVSGAVDSVLHIDTADSQGGAEFVSPPAELSKEQRESKQELLIQLFEVMRHGGVIASKQSQIPESGAAKAYTFAPVNSAIGKSRKIAMDVDEFVRTTMAFYTSQMITWDVTYKTDFTPNSPLDVVDLTSILNEFKTYDATEAELAVLKQLAMQVTGDDSLGDSLDGVNFDAPKEIE